MTKKEWVKAFKAYYGRKPNEFELTRGLWAGQYSQPVKKKLPLSPKSIILLSLGLVVLLLSGLGATLAYRYQTGQVAGSWEASQLSQTLSTGLEADLADNSSYYEYFKAYSGGNSFYTNVKVELVQDGSGVEAQVSYTLDHLALYSAISSVLSTAYGVDADAIDSVLTYDDFVDSMNSNMKSQAKDIDGSYDSKTATMTATLFKADVNALGHRLHLTEVNRKLYKAYFSDSLQLSEGKDLGYTVTANRLVIGNRLVFTKEE